MKKYFLNEKMHVFSSSLRKVFLMNRFFIMKKANNKLNEKKPNDKNIMKATFLHVS